MTEGIRNKEAWYLKSGALFLGYFCLILTRAWSGLDHIPSDPNYHSIINRLSNNNFPVLATTPYLHVDTPVLASIIALFPISWHGMISNLFTHGVWALTSTTIALNLEKLLLNRWLAFIGGLTLIFSPWASQSSLGNYGGVRWPILVAVLISVSIELQKDSPKSMKGFLATLVGSVCTPISFALLVPLAVGAYKASQKAKFFALIASIPPTLVLVMNILLTDGRGYSSKVSSFWEDASTYWITGQLIPVSFSLIGISLLAKPSDIRGCIRRVSLMIFFGSISIAAISFQLGGIADRYFVAPASLTSIGLLVGLIGSWNESRWRRATFAVLFTVVFLIPAVRWFSISPWLEEGPNWSSQIENARITCSLGRVDQIELLTSNGLTFTPPIHCSVLSNQS